MKIYEICFSPTGGTKKVSDILSSVWEEETIFMDLLKEPDENVVFQPEDVCLISVPSFGGRVPDIAVKRIAGLKGNGAKAVLVVVYGNRDYEDTLLELKDTADAAGFQCVAGITAIAEHSIMHQYAQGRPDETDRKQLQSFARQILEVWKEGQLKELCTVPGNVPYKEYGGVPFKPKAGRNCTRCEACVEACPVQAIPRENPDTVDTERCISCMHCIAVCPEHVRKVNKQMVWIAAQKMKKEFQKRKENELFL